MLTHAQLTIDAFITVFTPKVREKVAGVTYAVSVLSPMPGFETRYVRIVANVAKHFIVSLTSAHAVLSPMPGFETRYRLLLILEDKMSFAHCCGV